MKLSETEYELIHAAADGELSEDQWRQLKQLLSRSPDANVYYQLVIQDRQRLQQMPIVAPPDRLYERILRRLRLIPTVPVNTVWTTATTIQRAPSRWQRHIPWVIAASVLLAITAFSYSLSRSWLDTPQPHQQMARLSHPDNRVQSGESDTTSTTFPGSQANQPTGNSQTTSDATASPKVGHIGTSGSDTNSSEASTGTSVAVAPTPREATPPLTAPPIPPVTVSIVEAQLPYLRPLTDISRDDIRAAFVAQVQQQCNVRIDVFVRDLNRGVQCLQQAAAAARLPVLMDATTADRLRKLPLSSVVVCIDGLTAEEAGQLFEQINRHDMKFSPRVFDFVHLMPLHTTDERELREVLGTDPIKPFAKSDKAKLSQTQPLSSSTAEELVQSITKKNASEKIAVITTWQPQLWRTPPAASAELRSYAARRTVRAPNTVFLMLVLRIAPN